MFPRAKAGSLACHYTNGFQLVNGLLLGLLYLCKDRMVEWGMGVFRQPFVSPISQPFEDWFEFEARSRKRILDRKWSSAKDLSIHNSHLFQKLQRFRQGLRIDSRLTKKYVEPFRAAKQVSNYEQPRLSDDCPDRPNYRASVIMHFRVGLSQTGSLASN